MTRNEWRTKAGVLQRSAKVLLGEGHFDAAYHLAGLAVECALKAKIATRFRSNDIPAKKFVIDIYSHDLTQLVTHAGLQNQLRNEERANATFQAYWATVRVWDVDSRYKTFSEAEATDMVDAVSKRPNGVLAWIRRHW